MLESRSLPICDKCGSAVKPFHSYCWNCGEKLDLSKNTYAKEPENSAERLEEIVKEMGDLINKMEGQLKRINHS